MDSTHAENKETEQTPLSKFTSFQLLSKYGSKLQFVKEKTNEQASEKPSSSSSQTQVLSTQEIMQIAKEKLLQLRANKLDILSILICPFDLDSAQSLQVSSEDVELALLLQASAEMIEAGNHDRARKLLHLCDLYSSPKGNPVQRIVHYYGRALKERIDKVEGLVIDNSDKTTQESDCWGQLGDPEQALQNRLPAMIAIQQAVPFTQITRFTGIQAIMDGLGSARKIHVIDFGIRIGCHWTILMQALADRKNCLLEHFKVTAVGTSKDRIDRTGKWLSSFAEEMRLNFTFKAVEYEMWDLRKEHFELDSDEEIAIYMYFRLWTLLSRPDDLETFIGVLIKDLKPCIMVVIEAETSTNTTSFKDRFYESLVNRSAFFDCLETCLGENNQYREVAEELIIRQFTRNSIAEEGEKRTCRQENIKFWRSLFARFGIQERKLSESSLYQARLMVKESAAWSYCNLDLDGECLILGWKGTPIESLSAWMFMHDS